MTTLIPTAILLLSLAGGAGTAVDMYGDPQWRAEIRSSGEPQNESMRSLLQAVQAASRGESWRGRILQTVFVVPGPDLAPEHIAPIGEDLAVMCRIFDKAAVWADRTAGGEIGTAVPVDVSGIEISDNWISTQGLYLDGYGAIFFLPVSFPLAAPQQEQTPSEAEASGDPLWSQTADELRGVPQKSARPSEPQYDAKKVENLKIALIGTVRHASNLRTRRPEDVINIVIAGRAKQANFHEAYERLYGSKYIEQLIGSTAPSVSEQPSVLILRTTKSDVDALAKGNLTAEQFTGKVQFLKSWTKGGLEAVLTGNSPRPTIVAPSRNSR